MAIQVAERVKKIPPYLFSIIDGLKEEARRRGNSLIDLGMGNPDLPTPPHIVERLKEAAADSSTHRYCSARGDEELRKAIAEWYGKKYNVNLNFQEEVLPLIGSKEGIAVTYLTFLNPGDVAIVPTPSYPVHFNGVLLAEGVVHNLPITRENNFLPDLFSIPKEVLKRAKIIFLCYPNNPTAATVSRDFLKEAVAFARRYNLILVNDFTYSEITFDGYYSPSLLQIKGSREIGIEFHSFSKTYNMAGWRIGFVAGNSDLVNSIARVKRYIDFGIFAAIQKAATLALRGPQDCVRELCETYQRRRDVLVQGLRDLGWKMDSPKATMYVWASLPPRYSMMSSLEFTKFLLEKTGVVVSPGTGFGKGGEGYVRFALVESEKKIQEAVRRIGGIL